MAKIVAKRPRNTEDLDFSFFVQLISPKQEGGKLCWLLLKWEQITPWVGKGDIGGSATQQPQLQIKQTAGLPVPHL